VTSGTLAGTSLGLADQQITIGRASDATLVLTDDYAPVDNLIAPIFAERGF